ncbi:MAG: LLM class flavin-dependent oxidoreductase [SAR324 cluster bacterium]|nr:LLM class flavin-dependent oxidoreductase [SAR324 cluster bacterium]
MIERPYPRFGIFLAPFHPVDEHPMQALERDFDLVSLLDRLGYDEAWIGEHHSGGYETIASPEVFIAGAAERTRHIRLGTGVSSLPYHHPLLLADRIMQLDYQTRGRAMFGVGPGALPSDAFMMGIDPLQQRRMMDESLQVLVPLLSGEMVTRKTDWFALDEARLQFPPYTQPHIEMTVAAMTSPAGPQAAGKYGLGLLSIGSTTEVGYMALEKAWSICEQAAAEHKQQVSRKNWRLVAPMHIAETRGQAIENVRFGLDKWLYYYTRVIALPFDVPEGFDARVETLVNSGYAVIGDPDDAIAQLERLEKQCGGFGTFLHLATNWADWRETQRSYELFARYVIPHFQGSNRNRASSMNWVTTNRDRFLGAARQAKANAAEEYEQAQAGKKGKGQARP